MRFGSPVEGLRAKIQAHNRLYNLNGKQDNLYVQDDDEYIRTNIK